MDELRRWKRFEKSLTSRFFGVIVLWCCAVNGHNRCRIGPVGTKNGIDLTAEIPHPAHDENSFALNNLRTPTDSVQVATTCSFCMQCAEMRTQMKLQTINY